MNPIFNTENFTIRGLKLTDFEPFHEMQGNSSVMRFVRGKPLTYQENKEELDKLVSSYNISDNDFWIFAVERKKDRSFIGTVAFVKSEDHGEVRDKDNLILNIKEDECEIGYRLLEKYWGNGYAREIVDGLVEYAREIGFKRLIACAANENIASLKILKQLGFQFVNNFISEDLKIPEQKFELYL
jgi:RimJ/RimL family protein N-acetyltransferase